MTERRMDDEEWGLPVVVPLTILSIASACAEGAEEGSEGLSSAVESLTVPAPKPFGNSALQS